MFQRISFPPEALADIKALVSLSEQQLATLSTLLDSSDAAAPVDPSFVSRIQESLDVDERQADSITQVCVVLQRLDIDASDSHEVIEDFEELVRREAQENSQELLDAIDANREPLKSVVTRKPGITRAMRMRRIARGTQPAIESIRTLIQLRPLFERDEDNKPKDIECLVPAMSLEIKYKKGEDPQSATFSLTEETLKKLIRSLEDTSDKWKMVKAKYLDQICE